MNKDKKQPPPLKSPQQSQKPQDENPGGPPEWKDLDNSAPGKSSKNKKPQNPAKK